MANLTTAQKWSKELDSVGEWLQWDESEGKVSRIFCSKHVDRLKAIRNYSPAFIDGIVGSALKTDNVAKHKKSDMHSKAVNMELQPTRTISSILSPILSGKRSRLQRQRSPVASANYLTLPTCWPRRKSPFTKYPAIVELEK